MKLLELLNGVDYKVLQGSDEKEINKIQYDSRKIAENDLFVCLSGFEVDGHDYAVNAINAGATVVMCEKDLDLNTIPTEVTVLRVKEGRKALATMSANFYDHPTKKLKLLRSEERRVGKECRSRWSPYH